MDLSQFKKNKSHNVLQDKPVKIRKKIGRPTKELAEKLSCKITVNFTPAEKAKLEQRSVDNLGAPITNIIRELLKKQGYI